MIYVNPHLILIVPGTFVVCSDSGTCWLAAAVNDRGIVWLRCHEDGSCSTIEGGVVRTNYVSPGDTWHILSPETSA